MSLYRMLKDGFGIKKGKIILHYTPCHWCLVEISDGITATKYRHDLSAWDLRLHVLRDEGYVEKLSKEEIIKVSPHLTWRIWHHVASGLNSLGQMGFSFDILNEKKLVNGKKPRLIPPFICNECLKMGNNYVPHRFKTVKKGHCRVCNLPEQSLVPSYIAHPLNLGFMGFGSTISPTGRNLEMNLHHYEKNFLKEDWWNEYLIY